MLNLYSITKDLEELIEVISENGGEVSEEQAQLLEIRRDQLSEKVISYDSVIKHLDSQESLAKNEIKRLKEYIKKKKVLEETLKGNLLQALLLFGEESKTGVKSLQCDTVKLSTRKSKSIEIFNGEEIPDQYLDIDVTLQNLTTEQLQSLDTILKNNEFNYSFSSKYSKTRIKETIDKGEIVPGAEQKESVNLKIG